MTRRQLLCAVALVLCGSLRAGASDFFVGMSPPCRVVDTRTGPQSGIVTAGVGRDFKITGAIPGTTCSIPADADTVSLNVIVVSPSEGGFITLFPAGSAFPGVSTVNFEAGDPARSNGTIVRLRYSGTAAIEPSLRLVYGTGTGTGTTHIVVDVDGYFLPAHPFGVSNASLGTAAYLANSLAADPIGPPGVVGQGTTGVWGPGSEFGVLGKGLFGVRASTTTPSANYAETFVGSAGVFGDSKAGVGVYGASDTNAGVAGVSHDNYGIYGAGGLAAGYFNGNVQITGNLSIGGNLTKASGSFRIDDPIDPENKTLTHSFVESPDMKNLYDGTVVLDAQGHAQVELPRWFEALNQEFRYQLTCIGGFAPVYISREISGNRFEIAGGRPGLKVSWMVTGVRHDPYAEQHRLPVEEDKPESERGLYLAPLEYGLPADRGIGVAPVPPPRF